MLRRPLIRKLSLWLISLTAVPACSGSPQQTTLDASVVDASVVEAAMLDADADTLQQGEAHLDSAPPDGEPKPILCSEDMVALSTSCMDTYEASHQDATAILQGSSPIASSRAGVLPWFSVDLPTARAACTSAGKRLCRLGEWMDGCSGNPQRAYSYGDTYEPVTCNGIDTYCTCGSGTTCEAAVACPYPHCYSQQDTQGVGPCGAEFHVMPTGSFSGCKSPIGVFDLNGNVWELTDTDDGLEHYRGGAYNCADSEALHRCDHDGTWGPSAKGFRCCKDGAL